MVKSRSFLFGFLVTILVLTLSACDPASMSFTAVLQVLSIKDKAYAYVAQSSGWGPGCCGYGDPVFYSSKDGGNTWTVMASPPPEMEPKLDEAEARSSLSFDEDYNEYIRVDGLRHTWISNSDGKTWSAFTRYPHFETEENLAYKALNYAPVCSNQHKLECFRINEQGQIDHSIDGGATWSIDWQFPDGRSEYSQRRYALDHSGIPLDLRPLDLTIVDSDQEVGVIAAMGNQGIMVRTPQGLWERKSIGDAHTIPYESKSIIAALNIVLPEMVYSTIAANLFSTLLSGILYTILRINIHDTNRISHRPWFIIYLGYVIVVSLLALIWRDLVNDIIQFIPLLCLIFILGMLLLNWFVVSVTFKGTFWIRLTPIISFVYPLFLFIALFIPYLLWAPGIISALPIATLVSVISGSLISGLCIYSMVRKTFKIANPAVINQI